MKTLKINKAILGVVSCFFLAFTAQGQTEFMDRGGKTALEKGSFQINVGSGYSNWGIPIYVGMEYAFNEDITLGGFASYSTYSEDWGVYKWRHNVFSFFASGNMHVNRLLEFNDNVDLYGGVSLGFNSYSTEGDGVPAGVKYGGNKASGLLYGIQAGVRYYFIDNLGVNAELILGNLTAVHAGLTFRIR